MGSLAALVAFAFVSSVTPGPNNLMLWASGAEFGFWRAVPHVLGTAVGLGAMALAVAAGLGAVVTAAPAVAIAMKVAGSAYLLVLAYQVAGARALSPGSVARPLTLLQAAAFQVVNVKAWIFALGAMTTFRPPGLAIVEGSVLVAAVMMVVIVPSAAIWAGVGGSVGRFLVAGRRQRILSLVLAVLLAATVIDVWL